MQAAILAVGSELLGADRVDTNSLQLAEVLAAHGVSVAAKSVVGDDAEAISSAIANLLAGNELLLVTGGLGPTQDDLTREAVASYLGRQLVRSEEVLADLKRKFAAFGVEMAAVNEKQADVIEGAEVLENRRGTAPGQRIDLEASTIFLFPGVPHELEGLAASCLVPWLELRTGGSRFETTVFKVACVPESSLEQSLQSFYDSWGEGGVSLLPSAGEVAIRLSLSGTPDERREWLEPRCKALQELLGERIFTQEPGESLDAAAGRTLIESGLTIATAESCTGGLIAERLTRSPGSSAYFLGSIISYANDVKTRLLGVSAEALRVQGAVSQEVAVAMAKGARQRVGADLAVAVTGIAGPSGATEGKPVGTVHVALHGPKADQTVHRVLRLPGDRRRVRWVTSQWALELTRRTALASVAESSDSRV